MGLDLSALKPLNATTGTKNFAGYREKEAKGKRNEDAMDSDDDDDDVKIKDEDLDDEVDSSGKGLLSPEDARREGELEEGVRKIKVSYFPPCLSPSLYPSIHPSTNTPQLKRQHSAEPLTHPTDPTTRNPSASPISGTPLAPTDTPTDHLPSSSSSAAPPKSSLPDLASDTGASVGSPFKKQRASLPGFDEGVRKSLGATLAASAQKERGNSEGGLGMGMGLGMGGASASAGLAETRMEEDDEL